MLHMCLVIKPPASPGSLYSLSADGETKAPRVEITCPGSPGYKLTNVDHIPGWSVSRMHAPTQHSERGVGKLHPPTQSSLLPPFVRLGGGPLVRTAIPRIEDIHSWSTKPKTCVIWPFTEKVCRENKCKALVSLRSIID